VRQAIRTTGSSGEAALSHVAFKGNDAPLYSQIAEVLRQRIGKGVWSRGETIPTLKELMDEFSVAKVTVRRATKMLEQEGLLAPLRGRGTIVTAEPRKRRPLRVETKLADLIEMYSGDVPEVFNLEEDYSSPIYHLNDGKLADEYFHMRRIHSRDGERYCVISMFIEKSVFLCSEDRFRKELVLPVLFTHPTVEIARARQTMVISKCGIETAGLINICIGDPVAEMRRVLYNANDTVIYLADVIYRGDYISMDMELRP
jgi:GntR family transcriptional regulator